MVMVMVMGMGMVMVMVCCDMIMSPQMAFLTPPSQAALKHHLMIIMIIMINIQKGNILAIFGASKMALLVTETNNLFYNFGLHACMQICIQIQNISSEKRVRQPFGNTMISFSLISFSMDFGIGDIRDNPPGGFQICISWLQS